MPSLHLSFLSSFLLQPRLSTIGQPCPHLRFPLARSSPCTSLCSMVVNSKFQSTCPTHCLCLRLPECLPGNLWHSEQLISWRAFCLSLCTVRHDLQLYQWHNDGYQQCLRKAQKHIQGHNCIEAPQFGIRCQCSGLAHTVHVLVFGSVLQSTSCSRRWATGHRFQLTG
jgi:hypothetical protein